MASLLFGEVLRLGFAPASRGYYVVSCRDASFGRCWASYEADLTARTIFDLSIVTREYDMLDKLISFVRSALFAAVAATPLLGCSESDESAARFTLVGEEREVRGTVTDAKLTVCGTAPDKPGTCEGTLVIEPPGTGAAGRISVEVTRDVILKKDGQAVFLPQLRGNEVIVKYRASKEGPSVATSVAGQ